MNTKYNWHHSISIYQKSNSKSKQKPDDTLISDVQTEQHFVNLSSEDYKDENLIDDDMLKQNVFLRGIRSNQNKWWDRENDYSDFEAKNSSFPEFKLEKLLSSAGRSTYLMHFVNFNGRENVLIEFLVRTANILINNKEWRKEIIVM